MSRENPKFDRTIDGPEGEILRVVWMPGKRVRLEFKKCGKVAVTHIFPQALTKVELKYGMD
jgi:hypothetical protein